MPFPLTVFFSEAFLVDLTLPTFSPQSLFDGVRLRLLFYGYIISGVHTKVDSNLNHLANNTNAAADNNFNPKSSLHLDSLSVPLKSFQIKSIEIPDRNHVFFCAGKSL